MNPLPTSREAWLNEIAQALRDASEAIPFGPLVGASFGAGELFHLGPLTALKFRGMRRSKRAVREITEAALASLMHDFALTQKYVVLFDLPVTFSMDGVQPPSR